MNFRVSGSCIILESILPKPPFSSSGFSTLDTGGGLGWATTATLALVSAAWRAVSSAAISSAWLISSWRCWSERFWEACNVSTCRALSSNSVRRVTSWVCWPANLRVCITQTTPRVIVATARNKVSVLFINQDPDMSSLPYLRNSRLWLQEISRPFATVSAHILTYFNQKAGGSKQIPAILIMAACRYHGRRIAPDRSADFIRLKRLLVTGGPPGSLVTQSRLKLELRWYAQDASHPIHVPEETNLSSMKMQ